MRKIYVRFEIDWEDYEDVSDELVLEDMELELKQGVKMELMELVGIDQQGKK